MKKAFGLLLLGGLLVAGMATAALAASPGEGVRDFVGVGSQSGNGYAWGFADTDGDGVNDNFVDADGDGVCDNAGSGGGHVRTGGIGPGRSR
jgi:hypothetical protein